MSEIIEVVAALIVREDRIFAAQRGPGRTHAGLWEFPGGKIERGEAPRDALSREIQEELHVRSYSREFISTRETRDADRTIRVHLYRTIVESTAFECTEHARLAWLTLEEARALEWTQADAAFLEDIADVMASRRHAMLARPEALDDLPARAGGRHIFRALQRPWDAQRPHYSIGHKCRALVETQYDTSCLHIAESLQAPDGTTRIIYELQDGARVETIHMPRDVKTPRVTLCVSSQVGCAMNCAFCATATLGFRRNLTAAEIVQQVTVALDTYGPHETHQVNLVFMGMGEALMNVSHVTEAIEILSHPYGLNIPAVRMTLSTSGVLDGLDALKSLSCRPNLAVSINATTDEMRTRLMPITRKYGLGAIRAALESWPYRPHEKVLLEYVLLSGVNDSDEDARRLAAFALGLPHNINIIPYNATPRDAFCAPPAERVAAFIAILQEAGCFVTQRVARGVQVGGACGQLLSKRAGRI